MNGLLIRFKKRHGMRTVDIVEEFAEMPSLNSVTYDDLIEKRYCNQSNIQRK